MKANKKTFENNGSRTWQHGEITDPKSSNKETSKEDKVPDLKDVYKEDINIVNEFISHIRPTIEVEVEALINKNEKRYF